MNEFEKSLDLLNTCGNKLIPGDLSNRMAKRMEDHDKAYSISNVQQLVISEFESVPGITPASSRDLKDSSALFKLSDGSVISRYVNPMGFEHVFVSDSTGKFVYGGFVGWIHNEGLRNKTHQIKNKYAAF